MALQTPTDSQHFHKSCEGGQIRTRHAAIGAFTLIEMMVTIVVGIIVVSSIVTLSIITAQNFAATANYVRMDDQSRNALDRISREIRSSTALVAFRTNNPQFLRLTNSFLNIGVTITHNATSGVLTMTKTGEPAQTLLTGCDNFSFSLFNRYPLISNGDYTLCSSTNPATGNLDPSYCKVINLNWKCSRAILGSKLNTEVVQTARIVLRNQIVK